MPLLPNINAPEQLIPVLKLWQQALNPVLNSPVPPRTPFNFQANGGAAGATGITLSWEAVSTADGYEIQSSTTGDFSTSPILPHLNSPVATSFFDSTIVTNVKRWYRIRSTGGTAKAMHTIKGIWSAPISATSGSGVITYDQMSSTSGIGGWNNSVNAAIGSRFLRI